MNTVGPLRDAVLSDPRTAGGGEIDVFSVFDAMAVTADGLASSAEIMPAPGVAERIPSPPDRNIPGPPEESDLPVAAGSGPVGATPVVTIAPRPGTAAVPRRGSAGCR